MGSTEPSPRSNLKVVVQEILNDIGSRLRNVAHIVFGDIECRREHNVVAAEGIDTASTIVQREVVRCLQCCEVQVSRPRG